MRFIFDHDKNYCLFKQRKISFEQIIDAIEAGGLLAMENHPNIKKYPNQSVFYVKIDNEVYVTPFVMEDEETCFLKTIFASRKARKKFLKK